MFEKIKSNPLNQFYPLTREKIKKSESKLGIMFPKLLIDFYLEIGYGFIGSKVDNINRIMNPESVLDFRLKQNDFEFYPDIEIYDEFAEDKLVFFLRPMNLLCYQLALVQIIVARFIIMM